MRNKTAPVTPMANAATFNDLPDFVVDELAEVSDEGLAVVREGEDEREESVRERSVKDWTLPFGGGEECGNGGGLCWCLVWVLE